MYPRFATAIVVLVLLAAPAAQHGVPPRTFPDLVGTWSLDEIRTVERLDVVPRPPLEIAIRTTATTITVTYRPRLLPGDQVPLVQPPAVYRFDGTEAPLPTGRGRFTLVADAVALTSMVEHPDRSADIVTDAFSIDGGDLRLDRQVVHVTPDGSVATMSFDPNNHKRTYWYQKVAAGMPPNP